MKKKKLPLLIDRIANLPSTCPRALPKPESFLLLSTKIHGITESTMRAVCLQVQGHSTCMLEGSAKCEIGHLSAGIQSCLSSFHEGLQSKSHQFFKVSLDLSWTVVPHNLEVLRRSVRICRPKSKVLILDFSHKDNGWLLFGITDGSALRCVGTSRYGLNCQWKQKKDGTKLSTCKLSLYDVSIIHTNRIHGHKCTAKVW